MRWSGLVAAVLCSGAPAHAQYDIRLGELRPEIQAFGQPALVQSIQGNVENEFEQRNDALEEARETSSRPRTCSRCTSSGSPIISSRRSSGPRISRASTQPPRTSSSATGWAGRAPSGAALDRAGPAGAVRAFQIAIKGMPLAQLRDLLEAKTDLYIQALSNLEKEQSTLESNANSAASSARSYRQALLTAAPTCAGSRPRRSGTSGACRPRSSPAWPWTRPGVSGRPAAPDRSADRRHPAVPKPRERRSRPDRWQSRPGDGDGEDRGWPSARPCRRSGTTSISRSPRRSSTTSSIRRGTRSTRSTRRRQEGPRGLRRQCGGRSRTRPRALRGGGGGVR